jgi:hypothetical protein
MIIEVGDADEVGEAADVRSWNGSTRILEGVYGKHHCHHRDTSMASGIYLARRIKSKILIITKEFTGLFKPKKY